jgi:hypothetical protein
MIGYQDTSGLGAGLRHELGRLASHPLREAARLEHEADAGDSDATLGIILVAVAIFSWTLAAIMIAGAFAAAQLAK